MPSLLESHSMNHRMWYRLPRRQHAGRPREWQPLHSLCHRLPHPEEQAQGRVPKDGSRASWFCQRCEASSGDGEDALLTQHQCAAPATVAAWKRSRWRSGSNRSADGKASRKPSRNAFIPRRAIARRLTCIFPSCDMMCGVLASAKRRLPLDIGRHYPCDGRLQKIISAMHNFPGEDLMPGRKAARLIVGLSPQWRCWGWRFPPRPRKRKSRSA